MVSWRGCGGWGDVGRRWDDIGTFTYDAGFTEIWIKIKHNGKGGVRTGEREMI